MLAMVAFITIGASCSKTTEDNSAPVDKTDDFPEVEAGVVVKKYMRNTLGSIPNANIDYDEAKKYLTDDLKSQFADPRFVPASYCIQDEPDNVRLIPPELDGNINRIEVVVEGQYGGAWQEMWNFSLVPDGDLSWLIQKITCLNI